MNASVWLQANTEGAPVEFAPVKLAEKITIDTKVLTLTP
jgi:hypothetical protein